MVFASCSHCPRLRLEIPLWEIGKSTEPSAKAVIAAEVRIKWFGLDDFMWLADISHKLRKYRGSTCVSQVLAAYLKLVGLTSFALP